MQNKAPNPGRRNRSAVAAARQSKTILTAAPAVKTVSHEATSPASGLSDPEAGGALWQLERAVNEAAALINLLSSRLLALHDDDGPPKGIEDRVRQRSLAGIIDLKLNVTGRLVAAFIATTAAWNPAEQGKAES